MHRQNEDPDSERPLTRADDSFVFDAASGLYRHKSHEQDSIPKIKRQRSVTSRLDRSRSLGPSIARDWISIFLSAATLGAVLLYTYYSKQAVEAMKESEDRAWISIRNDEIDVTEGFSPTDLPQEGKALRYFNAFYMLAGFSLTIENTGHRAARKHLEWADIIPYTERNDVWQPPENWWVSTCSTARGQMSAWTAGLGEARPFYPGAIKADHGAWYDFNSAAPQYIKSIWIVACSAYQETNGDYHHTAVLFCPDRRSKVEKVLDKPEVWYGRQPRFIACAWEAN